MTQLPENRAGVPEHQSVYERLRAQVLFGDLAPGQAVTIAGLVGQLDAGMTPVREAIRRLIAEGALAFQGNRRVSVPELTTQGAQELLRARLALEPQLAERAVLGVTARAIDALKEADARLDGALRAGDVPGYLRMNYRFHKGLYELAQSPIMSGLVDSLWLRFGPSMRAVLGRVGTPEMPDGHKEAIEALQRSDGLGVAQAIAMDVRQGMDVLQQEIAG